MPNETRQPRHARQMQGALLGIHAQTSLHPGSGTALGTVDLAIQRERHTHWPMIAGSALKGILRDACREQVKGGYQEEKDDKGRLVRSQRRVTNEMDQDLIAVFGPAGQVDTGDSAAGALSITDARILGFPVRSLKGVFAWVTCKGVLDRLCRDAAIAGVAVPSFAVPDVSYKSNEEPKVSTPANCGCLVGDSQVVLEEFDFTRIDGKYETDATAITKWIADNLLPVKVIDPKSPQDAPAGLPAALPGDIYEFTRSRLKQNLVILDDDDFTHFVRHATEVTARIALNYDTKTASGTALFYQEFLPPETLLYSVVLADSARTAKDTGKKMQPDAVLQFVRKCLPSFLQIGGDETTGKGLCAVRLKLENEVQNA